MSAGYRPKDDSALTWAEVANEPTACRGCSEEHPLGVLEDGLCPACVDEDDEYWAVQNSGGLLP